MTGNMMGQRLRAILAEPGLAPNASVFNPMGARLIARSSFFKFAILSGFETAAMEYGLPDAGYLNSSDIAEVMSRISRAEPDLAVIVDGETGYGSPAHVRHTVLKHAMAGAAGVMIEDQAWPRQCPFITGGIAVISRSEAEARIRAALDAARDTGIVILARTDAKVPLGLDEALTRCRMFEDLGAEMLIVEGVSSEEEIALLCSATRLPVVINQHPGTSAPMLSPARLAELGSNRRPIIPCSRRAWLRCAPPYSRWRQWAPITRTWRACRCARQPAWRDLTSMNGSSARICPELRPAQPAAGGWPGTRHATAPRRASPRRGIRGDVLRAPHQRLR